MLLILPLLIGTTAVTGLTLVATSQRRPALYVARLAATILAVAATALRVLLPEGTSVPFTWLPGWEPVSFATAAPGIDLALMVLWLLAWALWLEPDLATDSSAAHTSLWPGVAYVLTALAVGAITVTNFVPRVVLIDMVALGAFASLALWRPHRPNQATLAQLFVVFRIGDLSLLLLVLWLGQRTGTYTIDSALGAAGSLPPPEQLLVLLAGIAAAWVKLGLPPTNSWAEDAALLPRAKRLVLLGGGLPLLGAYLLYRLQPLLSSLGLRPVVAGLGLVVVITSLGRQALRREPSLPAHLLLRLHGAFALALLATPVMRWYLWTFVPVRLFILLTQPQVAYALASPRTALLRTAGGVILSVAGRVEAALDLIAAGLANRCVRLAQRAHYHIELGLIERLLNGVSRALYHISGAVQRQHTGHLHRNLFWAIIQLAILIGLAFSISLL